MVYQIYVLSHPLRCNLEINYLVILKYNCSPVTDGTCAGSSSTRDESVNDAGRFGRVGTRVRLSPWSATFAVSSVTVVCGVFNLVGGVIGLGGCCCLDAAVVGGGPLESTAGRFTLGVTTGAGSGDNPPDRLRTTSAIIIMLYNTSGLGLCKLENEFCKAENAQKWRILV